MDVPIIGIVKTDCRGITKSEMSGFAIDHGGTKTAAVRIVEGQVTQYEERPTDGAAGPEGQYRQMKELLSKVGYRRDDRLAVAVTGRVDAKGE